MLSFVHGDIAYLGQGGSYVNDGQRAFFHHLADGQPLRLRKSLTG